MTKPAILLAVSDGFGGYGDFLFTLKLAQQLRKQYRALGEEIPPIYIVTQPSGKKTIQKLKGDEEFGIEVLTPNELRRRIDSDERDRIQPGILIEGPTFSSEFMERIDSALAAMPTRIPLIMAPEYGFSTASEIRDYEAYRQLITKFRKISHHQTIYSGFNAFNQEHGILLSDELRTPPSPTLLHKELNRNLRRALLGSKNIAAYQAASELSMQYSHDSYTPSGSATPAMHYLKIHREFAKTSTKNQDVLMVGKDPLNKRYALEHIKDQLIADGYARISFYNVDTKEEEILHDTGSAGKTYRVLYTAGMSHRSMIACTALSGPLSGATGDQSLSEAISANKIMVYECLPHKAVLIHDYDEAMKRASSNDAQIIETLHLLRTANTNEEYQRLGELLRDTALQSRFLELNRAVTKSNDLSEKIFFAGLNGGLKPLISLLREGQQAQAFTLLEKIMRFNPVSFFSKSGKKSIFEHALDGASYDIADYAIHSARSDVDRAQLSEILLHKNPQGETYLSQLRQNRPDHASTQYASFWATLFQLQKYKPEPGTKRAMMHNSFMELIKTFSDTAIEYDEKAFIGLLLLNKKNIESEYQWLSPRKGMFFGSKLYSICEDALKELGVDLRHMTPEQEQEYYRALQDVINKKPDFLRNEYILQSLSQHAGIEFPHLNPLIPWHEAKEILVGKQDGKERTILRTARGFYKLMPEMLGKGNWGSVYTAQHYSLDNNGNVVVSEPCAIKRMPRNQAALLDKEYRLFQQAYPDKFFERVEKGSYSCLAMPLFPGIPLDKYLLSHGALTMPERRSMAIALLSDLDKLHENGLTHNDLKLKNILFDPITKKMHIIDFGCAEFHNTYIKYENIDSSIFAFEMPPEYLAGTNTKPTLDIFAVTPILAEILGISKKDIVTARILKAFEAISDDALKRDIMAAFQDSDNLGDAFFHPLLTEHATNPNLQAFINKYVATPYDFTPYEAQVGADIISLLNNMQSADPVDRPSLELCLEQLRLSMTANETITAHEPIVATTAIKGRLRALIGDDTAGEGEDIHEMPDM